MGPHNNYCMDTSFAIIDLNTVGLMNVTIWYEYGAIFPDLTSPSYTYMENANFTIEYKILAV